jgi:Patatin-like phospholipase
VVNRARSFTEILREELWEITRLRRKRSFVDDPDPACSQPDFDRDLNPATAETPERVFAAAQVKKFVGLALSGGGIRSATFGLGILQGFAEAGILNLFDYISTVSGGGYIGSWLTAWIRRRGLKNVEDGLKPTRSTQPDQERKERPEIRFLRDYSNYLTPRLGLLGADTWTGVAIYLRNLFLNQSILILFLSSLLLLPHLLALFARAHQDWFRDRNGISLWVLGQHPALLWIAILLALVCVVFTAVNMHYFSLWPHSEQDIYARVPAAVPNFHEFMASAHAPAGGAADWRSRLHDGSIIEVWNPSFTRRLTPAEGLRVRINSGVAAGAPGRVTLAAPQGAQPLPLPAGSFIVRRRPYPPVTQYGWVWATVILPQFLVAWLVAMWMWANASDASDISRTSLCLWAFWGAIAFVAMWLVAFLTSRFNLPGKRSGDGRGGRDIAPSGRPPTDDEDRAALRSRFSLGMHHPLSGETSGHLLRRLYLGSAAHSCGSAAGERGLYRPAGHLFPRRAA